MQYMLSSINMGDTMTEIYSDLKKKRAEGDLVPHFDEHAVNYDKFVVRDGYIKIITYAAGLLKEITSKYRYSNESNIKVLDVGCGTGLFGASLKELGFEDIDGLDASRGMLEKAAEKNIYKNLSLGRISATDFLDINDGQYDAVIYMGCIAESSIELKYALPEFLRLLKDGGLAHNSSYAGQRRSNG